MTDVAVVAVCGPAGSAAQTTTGLLLASSMPEGQPVVFAECDSSGGDVAAWCGLREQPGWSTAVAAGDRSWAGLRSHFQQVQSGLSVLAAPTRAAEASVVLREAASRFGSLLRGMPDVVTIADCGRLELEVPVWVRHADLVLLVLRQSTVSAGATVARVDRAIEAAARLRAADVATGLLVVGARPYPVEQLAEHVGLSVAGVLPEDPAGAGLAAGAWTVGRGASRSALARAARTLAPRVLEGMERVSRKVMPLSSREEAG